ncbi:universal stress protein [Halorientalis sp.]|jgi:nucleotide-binding universal stress UspA family protein|uniref:universal stress protein n=1 Tax=Halorientalis sp. TaxID=1931229 RepID=UPI0026350E8A|nr:universal stress protein [Halorientalis sp.]
MGVLIAVSDDTQFETVLTVGVQLAVGLSQELYVTHITATETASGDEQAFRDNVRESLSDVDVPVEVDLEHLSRGGLRSGTAVGKQLLEIAEDTSIDHIVIGHRSKSRLSTVREGHTGFVVAQEAAVPVTIVPDTVES